MNKENWQRLKNLSLFKLWVTDKQLSRLWPLAALITAITADGYFHRIFFSLLKFLRESIVLTTPHLANRCSPLRAWRTILLSDDKTLQPATTRARIRRG